MAEKGWVKLFRKIVEWEWYSDINATRIFLHLILTANYEPARWQGVTIQPGQKVTSLPHLAEETGLTIRQARTALDKLKLTGEITDESNNKFRLITLKKWAEYQSNDRQHDRQMTGKRHATRQASDSNIRNKEEKNKERDRDKASSLPLTPTPKDDAISFFGSPERQVKAVAYFVSRGTPEDVAKSEIEKFIDYWTELDKTGRKQKWQMKPTFEVTKRLATWINNAAQFSSQRPKQASGTTRLHDGTEAKWWGGRWVDAQNPTVSIDVSYYPELTKK